MEINVLEVLKLGFSGLAFLLALLAYFLLYSEQKNKEPRKRQLDAISKFMSFSIILGLIVALTPFIPKVLEEKPNLLYEAMLEAEKSRKSMPIEFVKSQISALTEAHNKRLDLLYIQRSKQEDKLAQAYKQDKRNVYYLERRISKTERDIDSANRDYDSQVRSFRNML